MQYSAQCVKKKRLNQTNKKMYLEHLSCKNYRKTKYKYRDIKIFEKPTTKSICQWFQQRNTIISLLRCEDLTVFFVCVFCSFTFCTWFIVSNLQYSIDYYYYGCMNAFSVTRFRAYRLFYCFASRIIFFFFVFVRHERRFIIEWKHIVSEKDSQ